MTIETMDYQRMMAALSAIGDCSIHQRSIGDWYVSLRGVEIGGDGMLRSPASRASTPEAAVVDAWLSMTNLTQGQYLVLNAMLPTRRAVRWNGFMWVDVVEHVRTAKA
jgi:hypothetical protein